MNLWGLLIAVLVVVLVTDRIVDACRDREWWRNSTDPEFQGDGWRWTLSIVLPGLLLYRVMHERPRVPLGAPFTLAMLVLTREQRESCYAEWLATQRQYERWEAEAMWRDRFDEEGEPR